MVHYLLDNNQNSLSNINSAKKQLTTELTPHFFSFKNYAQNQINKESS